MKIRDFINPEMFKDMSVEQIIEMVEGFGINIPEQLAELEKTALSYYEKLRAETGTGVLLLIEPNSTRNQVEITIYKDLDGKGDLQAYKKFPFTDLLSLIKSASKPNTNTEPHEEPQTKQIGSPGFEFNAAAGGHVLTASHSASASGTDPEAASARTAD